MSHGGKDGVVTCGMAECRSCDCQTRSAYGYVLHCRTCTTTRMEIFSFSTALGLDVKMIVLFSWV